jgi:hypothetical protein
MIPNGATIDESKSTISFNGSVIATYSSCSDMFDAGYDAGYNNVAWTQASVTNATELQETITVPARPSNPVGGETLFLWQGLYVNGDLLQPEIVYDTSNYSNACPAGSGGFCYETNAFFWGNKSHLTFYTPAYLANPGDTVRVQEYTTGVNSWEMDAINTATSTIAWATVTDPTPASSAIAYINSAEIYGIAHCNALPNSIGYAYWDAKLYTGATWNTYNLVANPNWADYYGWNSGMGIPECTYSSKHGTTEGHIYFDINQ